MEPIVLFTMEELEDFNALEKYFDTSSITHLESNDHVEDVNQFAGNEMEYDQLDSLVQNELDYDLVQNDEENRLWSYFQSPIKKEISIEEMNNMRENVTPTEFARRLFPQYEWDKLAFPFESIHDNNPDMSGQDMLDIFSEELHINTSRNEISAAASIEEESINALNEDEKSPSNSSSSKYDSDSDFREKTQVIGDTYFMQRYPPLYLYEMFLSHDHSYVKPGPPPEEHQKEPMVDEPKQSQLETATVPDRELKIRIRLTPRDANREPAKESIKPIKEPKKRGRPKRIQPAKPLPEVKAARKRKASSVAKRQTKKPKVQPAPSRKAKPTVSKSKPNSKQMTNDKREQHNRAERERRNNLKNHLLRLEVEVPQQVLQNAQAAIIYVKQKKKQNRENNLSVNVMSRLNKMRKRGITGKASAKSKKGAHFPKVVVLQATIYYLKLLDLEYKMNEAKIADLMDILRMPDQSYTRRREKKLKVQNAIPMSKPRRSAFPMSKPRRNACKSRSRTCL